MYTCPAGPVITVIIQPQTLAGEAGKPCQTDEASLNGQTNKTKSTIGDIIPPIADILFSWALVILYSGLVVMTKKSPIPNWVYIHNWASYIQKL